MIRILDLGWTVPSRPKPALLATMKGLQLVALHVLHPNQGLLVLKRRIAALCWFSKKGHCRPVKGNTDLPTVTRMPRQMGMGRWIKAVKIHGVVTRCW